MSVATKPLWVVCLCAAWCRTCDAYRTTFADVERRLAAARPADAMRFAWLDIEDESNLLGNIDIIDFPTLMLARDGQPQFFGAVLPHAQTLERLVSSVLDSPPSAASTTWPADLHVVAASLVQGAALRSSV